MNVRTRRPALLLTATVLAVLGLASAFVVPIAPRAPVASSGVSSSRSSRSVLPMRRAGAGRRPLQLSALGPEHVYLAADIKKIVSDEIYGPMFFQALLLSVSGFLAAAALAAVIIFKGDSLTTELLNEAYEERDSLRERVGASEGEDGTIVVGFGEQQQQQQPQEAAAPVAAAEKEKEKELVGSAASGGGGAAVNDFED